MFCRMGLDTNIEKTNYMVCTPIFIWGKWSEEAYKQQTMGERVMLRESKSKHVGCTE